MTVVVGILLFGIFMVALPFGIVGFITKGWRPFMMTLVLWALAVFVFHLWAFGWLYLPFQYFLALLGYVAGAKIRTGKEVEQIMGEPTVAGEK